MNLCEMTAKQVLIQPFTSSSKASENAEILPAASFMQPLGTRKYNA